MKSRAQFRIDGHDFDAAVIQTEFSRFQAALSRAHASRSPSVCLCRPGGVPMVIYKRDIFHLRRFPGQADLHAVDCRSHTLTDDCAIYSQQFATLRYPQTLFIKHRSELNSMASAQVPTRATGRRGFDPLHVIFDRLWRSASLHRWSECFRPWPWQRVAANLCESSKTISMGSLRLSDRVILLGNQKHIPAWDQTSFPPTSRRVIKIAIGPIRTVFATKHDICIAPYDAEHIWSTAQQCRTDFELAARLANTVDGSYVIAVMAVYWDRNLRCRDWYFIPVTHTWHPFKSAVQGKLYQRLVADQRRFSIPANCSEDFPWAVVYDAAGGPRAIVSQAAHDLHSFYPPWRWAPGLPLPNIGNSNRALSATPPSQPKKS